MNVKSKGFIECGNIYKYKGRSIFQPTLDVSLSPPLQFSFAWLFLIFNNNLFYK